MFQFVEYAFSSEIDDAGTSQIYKFIVFISFKASFILALYNCDISPFC